MRLPGTKLVLRSYRWARSRLIGGVVVLGYHRLGHGDPDPFEIDVPYAAFEEQLAIIARHACPASLRDALQAVRERRVRPRSVVVTFDDGYLDTVQEVLPLLERYRIPATVFVTTGSQGTLFWWDELAALLLQPVRLPERLEMVIGGSRRVWSGIDTDTGISDGDADRRRHRLLLSLSVAFQEVSVAQRTELLTQLRTWAQHEPQPHPTHRALTASEIQQLAASPLVEIGAHTVGHPALKNLHLAAQRTEIVDSKVYLEELTGTTVTSFSYPHGSYAPSTVNAVRDAGFTAACCSVPDVMTSHSSVLEVPRLWVQGRSTSRFSAWLNRWLVG